MTSRTGMRNNGLTLVEILVSVVILASAMVLIMQAFARGAQALSLARNRLRAYSFAMEKMADLELDFVQQIAPRLNGQFHRGHDLFHWRVEATAVADEPQLQWISLIVSWPQNQSVYESRVGLVIRAVPQPS